MRIFLSANESDDRSYKWANSLPMMDGLVLNSEATNIVCDNFISSFALQEIQQVLNKVVSKMRIGCELTIIDVDCDLLSRSLHVEEFGIEEANKILFDGQKRKSLFNMQKIRELIPSNIDVSNIHFENSRSQFILKGRRKS